MSLLLASTQVRVSFPTPSGLLTAGTNLQEFRVLVRKSSASGGVVFCSVQLWEAGVRRATLAVDTPVSSTTGSVISALWDASSLTDSTGAGVECYVRGTQHSLAALEVGAIEWNPALTAVTPLSGVGSGSPRNTSRASGALSLVGNSVLRPRLTLRASGALAQAGASRVASRSAIAALPTLVWQNAAAKLSPRASVSAAATLRLPASASGAPRSSVVAQSRTTDTEVRVSFPTPAQALQPGAGLQEFRAQVRKKGTASSAVVATVELWESGFYKASLSSTAVSSTTGAVVSVTWDASLLTDVTGAGVECRVFGQGSASDALEVGAIEWNATQTSNPALAASGSGTPRASVRAQAQQRFAGAAGETPRNLSRAQQASLRFVAASSSVPRLGTTAQAQNRLVGSATQGPRSALRAQAQQKFTGQASATLRPAFKAYTSTLIAAQAKSAPRLSATAQASLTITAAARNLPRTRTGGAGRLLSAGAGLGVARTGVRALGIGVIPSQARMQERLALRAVTRTTDTGVRVSFTSPSFSPQTGSGLQEFRIQARKKGTASSAVVATVELWENGIFRSALTSIAVTSITSQVVSATWDATLLTDSSGAGVECRVVGQGSATDTLEIGAVEWNATLADTLTQNGAGRASPRSAAKVQGLLSYTWAAVYVGDNTQVGDNLTFPILAKPRAKVAASASTPSVPRVARSAPRATHRAAGFQSLVFTGPTVSDGTVVGDNLVLPILAKSRANTKASGTQTAVPLQVYSTQSRAQPRSAVRAQSRATDTALRVSFPTPSAALATDSRLQEFRIRARKKGTSSSAVVATVELWESGAYKTTLSSVAVTSTTTGTIVSATWSATLLTDSSGAGVECRLYGQGSASDALEIGAVTWNPALATPANLAGGGAGAPRSSSSARATLVTNVKALQAPRTAASTSGSLVGTRTAIARPRPGLRALGRLPLVGSANLYQREALKATFSRGNLAASARCSPRGQSAALAARITIGQIALAARLEPRLRFGAQGALSYVASARISLRTSLRVAPTLILTTRSSADSRVGSAAQVLLSLPSFASSFTRVSLYSQAAQSLYGFGGVTPRGSELLGAFGLITLGGLADAHARGEVSGHGFIHGVLPTLAEPLYALVLGPDSRVSRIVTNTELQMLSADSSVIAGTRENPSRAALLVGNSDVNVS